MAVMLQSVAELMADRSDYDETFVMPSAESYEYLRQLLQNLGYAFPAKSLSTSVAAIGDGGIFIEWKSVNNYVRLIVPPNPDRAYLHCRCGSRTRTIREVSSSVLAECLKWMIRHERPCSEKE